MYTRVVHLPMYTRVVHLPICPGWILLYMPPYMPRVDTPLYASLCTQVGVHHPASPCTAMVHPTNTVMFERVFHTFSHGVKEERHNETLLFPFLPENKPL